MTNLSLKCTLVCTLRNYRLKSSKMIVMLYQNPFKIVSFITFESLTTTLSNHTHAGTRTHTPIKKRYQTEALDSPAF